MVRHRRCWSMGQEFDVNTSTHCARPGSPIQQGLKPRVQLTAMKTCKVKGGRH
eukprot:jgi/Mesvir1/28898/Mv25722-RA.1